MFAILSAGLWNGKPVLGESAEGKEEGKQTRTVGGRGEGAYLMAMGWVNVWLPVKLHCRERLKWLHWGWGGMGRVPPTSPVPTYCMI